jgi:hypothetical protein
VQHHGFQMLPPYEGGIQGGSGSRDFADIGTEFTPLYPPFVRGEELQPPRHQGFATHSTVLPLTPPLQGGENTRPLPGRRNENGTRAAAVQGQHFTGPVLPARFECDRTYTVSCVTSVIEFFRSVCED